MATPSAPTDLVYHWQFLFPPREGYFLRKIAVLTIACILLIIALAGCSGDVEPASAPQETANFLPETTALPAATAAPSSHPVTPEPTLPQIVDEPLEAPVDATITPNAEMLAAFEEDMSTPEPTAEAAAAPESTQTPEPTAASPYLSYNYSMLTDTAFGFVLNYPSTWSNLPGKYTVCFQEPVSDGDFPARVAVSSKKMPHKPDSDTILKQFQSFAKQIYGNYDPSTFEFGDLQSNASFMGQRAMAISYLAYSGDIEVKGYMCCCAIDYTIYVFHFCSSYNDYEDMLPVLTRIKDSVTLVK